MQSEFVALSISGKQSTPKGVRRERVGTSTERASKTIIEPSSPVLDMVTAEIHHLTYFHNSKYYPLIGFRFKNKVRRNFGDNSQEKETILKNVFFNYFIFLLFSVFLSFL